MMEYFYGFPGACEPYGRMITTSTAYAVSEREQLEKFNN